jgi:alpha-L-rhamnosidase
LWTGLRQQGLRTVVEQPEPTRSDCHAWGAHPIFHLYATVLGVRPTAPGMVEVTVTPQLGGLHWADGTLRTPPGPLRIRADRTATTVDLPPGIRRQQAGGRSKP